MEGNDQNTTKTAKKKLRAALSKNQKRASSPLRHSGTDTKRTKMIQTFFTRFLFRCCPRAGIGNRNRRKGVDLKVVISNDVLLFPSLSSEWYARQQKPLITLPESRLEETDKDPRVFRALSKSWHQRRAKLLFKNDSLKRNQKQRDLSKKTLLIFSKLKP